MNDEVNRRDEETPESRIYEIGYLLLPTISEEVLPQEVTALKDVLEKEKAMIISEEFPRFRALSYGMRKRTGGTYQTYLNAYFGWVKFEVKAGSAARIERELKKHASLLRFMLIKTVREQTFGLGRPLRTERAPRREAPKDVLSSVPVSEIELDKSLEKLIGES